MLLRSIIGAACFRSPRFAAIFHHQLRHHLASRFIFTLSSPSFAAPSNRIPSGVLFYLYISASLLNYALSVVCYSITTCLVVILFFPLFFLLNRFVLYPIPLSKLGFFLLRLILPPSPNTLINTIFLINFLITSIYI